MKVAILGASAKPDRYAFKAQERLLAAGHEVVGVSPAALEIGIDVVTSVASLPSGIETLTVYVGAKGTAEIQDQILGYGFKRVIFNPGAENAALMASLMERDLKPALSAMYWNENFLLRDFCSSTQSKRYLW